ncbi:DUF6207 family protein [Streptomyces sp. A0958]|uniref:DUF6207 family protein n=1 Tax=Streptomyces sp. A0958 TaxID=2563101 RepID=UPI001F1091AE|nr:DUF6207 family protein [Streptomyces sp. A0958]
MGANRAHRLGVRDGMKEISEQHISEPCLVALDITAADEDTLRLVVARLEERWATSGPAPVQRVPGPGRCDGPGVRGHPPLRGRGWVRGVGLLRRGGAR